MVQNRVHAVFCFFAGRTQQRLQRRGGGRVDLEKAVVKLVGLHAHAARGLLATSQHHRQPAQPRRFGRLATSRSRKGEAICYESSNLP